jgi:phosphomannomutase
VPRVLFGTDGIRGVAGVAPLDHKTAQAVGAALGHWVLESKPAHARVPSQVVIGMDTRESGPWLAADGRERLVLRAAPRLNSRASPLLRASYTSPRMDPSPPE